jgi:hypothetical protein
MTFICFPLLQGKESNDDPQAAKKLQHKIDKEKKEKYKKQDADLLKAALANTSWKEWIKTFDNKSHHKFQQQYCKTTFQEFNGSIRSFKFDEKKIASIITCTRQYPKLMQNSYGGHTPLHIAASRDQTDIVELLIRAGANPNVKDQEGLTPLHLAAGNHSSTNLASTLISEGANVNAKNKYGYTPLHIVAFSPLKDLAELLIGAGANIHAQDKDGKTPLHFAASYRRNDTAALLIHAGANIHAQDKDGKTPLDIAKKYKNTQMIQLLEKAIEKQNKQL